jgi:cytochrome b561
MNEIRQPSFDPATRVGGGDDGTTYDRVAIALHWTTAVLVIVQFALGQTWDWFAKATRELMENTHMSFGVLLTAVILARLVWRLIPGHQVASIEAGWMRVAARATHYLLYALLATETVLGFTFRWGAGRPMYFFGTGIPPLIGQMAKPVTHNLKDIHNWVGWAIIVIATAHALAALYHHYVLKDRVLVRMLPRAARP